jgi:hypothetical protein
VRRPRGIGEALGFIFVGEFHEFFKRTRVLVHCGMRVANSLEALGDGEDGEIGGVAVGDFTPVEGCGNTSVGERADRVG